MLRIQVTNSNADFGKQQVMCFDIPQGDSRKVMASINMAVDYAKRVGPGILIQITCDKEI